MYFEEVIQKTFKGYCSDRIESLMEILNGNDIMTISDLDFVKEDELIQWGLSKVEAQKLMALKDASEDLEPVLAKIFKGESPEKIAKYLNILHQCEVLQKQHLPLALDMIDSHNEISPVDKRKFKKYVKENYKSDYDEQVEKEKETKSDKNTLRDQDHEVKMKKLDMIDNVVKVNIEEKKMILEREKEIHEKIQTENGRGIIGRFFASSSSNISNNMDLLSLDRKRLVTLDDKIDECVNLSISISEMPQITDK